MEHNASLNSGCIGKREDGYTGWTKQNAVSFRSREVMPIVSTSQECILDMKDNSTAEKSEDGSEYPVISSQNIGGLSESLYFQPADNPAAVSPAVTSREGTDSADVTSQCGVSFESDDFRVPQLVSGGATLKTQPADIPAAVSPAVTSHDGTEYGDVTSQCGVPLESDDVRVPRLVGGGVSHGHTMGSNCLVPCKIENDPVRPASTHTVFPETRNAVGDVPPAETLPIDQATKQNSSPQGVDNGTAKMADSSSVYRITKDDSFLRVIGESFPQVNLHDIGDGVQCNLHTLIRCKTEENCEEEPSISESTNASPDSTADSDNIRKLRNREKIKCKNVNGNSKENGGLKLTIRCMVCSRVFGSMHSMSVHIARSRKCSDNCAPRLPFKCRICSKICSRFADLKRHELKHMSERPYKCQYCDKSFKSLAHVNSHKRSHTRSYCCRYCQMEFPSKAERSAHLKMHKNEKRLECRFCTKKFRINYDRAIHERTHTGDKPYRCDFCSKSFSSYTGLLIHFKSHSDRRPFRCRFCSRCFKFNTEKTKHEKRHMGLEKRLYKCEFCEKAFIAPSNLEVHVRTHTGEEPFKCNFCPKAFKAQGNFVAHIRIHTGEKPYKCKYCPEAFNHPTNRKVHERCHTGEKPHKCQHCEKRFACATRKRSHERSHTGERPYQCRTCPKAFSTSGNRQRHESTHG